jgi:hypothetical protein
MSKSKRKSKSFWTTLPVILGAITALIGAAVGLLNLFHTLGWLGNNTHTMPKPTETPIIIVSTPDTITLINRTLRSNSPEKTLPLLDNLVKSEASDELKDDECMHVFKFCIANKRLDIAKEVINKFISANYQKEATAIYKQEVFKQITQTK